MATEGHTVLDHTVLDIKSLHPVRVYYDKGNTVVVQRIANGFEHGKYIISFNSSVRPFHGWIGSFRLTPSTEFPDGVFLGAVEGWADVYEYSRKIEKPLK
jgi:hypothetical protein